VVPGAFAIRPATELPALADDRTTIDGTTQEDNRGDRRADWPDIVLSGTSAGNNAVGLTITGSRATIRNLEIRGFTSGTGTAILIDGTAGGDNNLLADNHLTQNSNGGGWIGALYLLGQADNNRITGNRILANNSDGLAFGAGTELSTGNRVTGNTFRDQGQDGAVLRGSGMIFSGNAVITNGPTNVFGCGIELQQLTSSTISVNTATGNGFQGGICVLGSASQGNTIGPNNTLVSNSGPGVSVLTAASVRNRITANTIFDNGGLGIDLGADGVTANDLGDGDVGPNDLRNAPVIYSAVLDGLGGLTITGEAAPGSVVELFGAAPDPLGAGEGRSQIGSVLVGAGPAGLTDPSAGQFSVTVPVGSLAAGDAITATCTDSTGSTSEFAANVNVQ
jgi:hypothetical protein